MSTPTVPQAIASAQANKETPLQEDIRATCHQSVYAYREATSSGLTFGYHGGRWGGFSVAAGALALTGSATNYIVVLRSSGVPSVSTSSTNWNDSTNYARVYRVTTDGSGITNLYGSDFDYRAGPGGVHGPEVGAAAPVQCLAIACSDESTALTTGAAKVTFHMPFDFNLTGISAGVTVAPTGADLIVDVNEGGTSIMTTDKLRIDAGEESTHTAATPPTLTDTVLAAGSKITIDVDQVGSTIAGAGLKVYLLGRPA